MYTSGHSSFFIRVLFYDCKSRNLAPASSSMWLKCTMLVSHISWALKLNYFTAIKIIKPLNNIGTVKTWFCNTVARKFFIRFFPAHNAICERNRGMQRVVGSEGSVSNNILNQVEQISFTVFDPLLFQLLFMNRQRRWRQRQQRMHFDTQWWWAILFRGSFWKMMFIIDWYLSILNILFIKSIHYWKKNKH